MATCFKICLHMFAVMSVEVSHNNSICLVDIIVFSHEEYN